MASSDMGILAAPRFPGEGVADWLLKAYYEAYNGYLQVYSEQMVCSAVGESVSSSAVSAVTDASSVPSINSSASTSRAKKRQRWRLNNRRKSRLAASANFASNSSSVVSVAHGKCYLLMFAPGADVPLAPMPTFRELLRCSADGLLDGRRLAELRLCRTAEGVYHVGERGAPLDVTLGVLARREGSFLPGTVGREFVELFPGAAIADGGPTLDDVVGARSFKSLSESVKEALCLIDVSFLDLCGGSWDNLSAEALRFPHDSVGLSAQQWFGMPGHAHDVIMKMHLDDDIKEKAEVICAMVEWYWSAPPGVPSDATRLHLLGRECTYDPFQFVTSMTATVAHECYLTRDSGLHVDKFPLVEGVFTYAGWAALPARSRGCYLDVLSGQKWDCGSDPGQLEMMEVSAAMSVPVPSGCAMICMYQADKLLLQMMYSGEDVEIMTVAESQGREFNHVWLHRFDESFPDERDMYNREMYVSMAVACYRKTFLYVHDVGQDDLVTEWIRKFNDPGHLAKVSDAANMMRYGKVIEQVE